MAKEATATPRRRRGPNAIELLQADHRRIERLFRQFADCRSAARRAALQAAIAEALTVHIALEEECLHPAFPADGAAREVIREAQAGNACVRGLLRQIQALRPGDAHLRARMAILAGVFQHYLREEEGAVGLFALARQHQVDLDAIGALMRSRRWHLLVGGRRRPRAPLTSAGTRSTLRACAPLHGIGPG